MINRIIPGLLLMLYSIGLMANGITPSSILHAKLINQGRRLFFNETFNGNGRTCGTCHPANNNYTIDPKYIATLSDDNPLFVAEHIPALANNFEKPELMRKLGLILENTNGFDDLENNFTLRRVSHISALRTTVSPPSQGNDGTLTSHLHRTGWSGDIYATYVLDSSQLPFDDGFASGSNLFNVPPVIEAADTGTFFHSNQINTIEGMISFYASTRVFRNGSTAPLIVPLNGSQLANVSAFVRVLNADENSRLAIQLIEYAKMLRKRADKRINLSLAKSEIRDAIRVLNEGRIHHDDAILSYRRALRYLQKSKLSNAMSTLQQTREIMINRPL